MAHIDDLLKDMDEVLNVHSPQKPNNKPPLSASQQPQPKASSQSPPKKVFFAANYSIFNPTFLLLEK
jgi:hypothetical protein